MVTTGCAKLLTPVMPEKCQEVFKTFGMEKENDCSPETSFSAGKSVAKIKSLFPRVRKPEKAKPEKSPKKENKKSEKQEGVQQIEFTDFTKVKLHTAKVLVAERVPKTDKLMRIELDIGFEKRQIVAGIAKDYAPEDIIGKTIVVVSNLKPRKLRGVESNGMLLAAHGKDGLSLVTVDRPVEPGSSVS